MYIFNKRSKESEKNSFLLEKNTVSSSFTQISQLLIYYSSNLILNGMSIKDIRRKSNYKNITYKNKTGNNCLITFFCYCFF